MQQVRQAISQSGVPGEHAGASSDLAFPAHLSPFQGLRSLESDVYGKLAQDPLIETYSVYGFFPDVHDRIYTEGARPTITFGGRARGLVAMLEFEDLGLVVKPIQSHREGEIASIAGKAGAGPVQYPSLPGYLTEERLSGAFFTEMAPENVGDDSMYRTGAELAGILRRLHQRRIYYNDATLSDPSGRSHMIVEPGGRCHLIDFGVSILLDRHPLLDRYDVYNFARTLPIYQVLKRMALGGADMDRFLDDYSQKLRQTSPDELMSQDLRFAEEGLKMAARGMGRKIVEPFTRGFREAYNS